MGPASKPAPIRQRWSANELGSRPGVIVMLAIVYWVAAATENTIGGYAFAGVASVWLVIQAAWPWMRSKGVPEWSASEAYVTRWRRWRRSKQV
jgi:hypothetical protein